MKITHFALAALAVSGCAHAQQPPAPVPPIPPTTRPAKPEPVAASAMPLNPQTIEIFPLRDNDIWVMVGDSITEQKLYSAYMEAFVRARYPRMPFAAVHSGKSGEVFIQGNIRFRRTVAAYKPTFITANFGMNDHTKVFPTEPNFLDKANSGPQRFVEAAKATGARVALLSASPLVAPANYATDGGKFKFPADGKPVTVPGGWRSNPVNKLFAEKLRQLADHEGVYFIDQQTPLQIIWAAAYERDAVAAIRDSLRPVLAEPITTQNWRQRFVAIDLAIRSASGSPERLAALPLPDRDNFLTKRKTAQSESGIEAFRLYLLDWLQQVDRAEPPFVRVSGYSRSSRPNDPIHPNEAGHLHMAAAILKQMKADGLVSSVTIDGKTGKLLSAEKATVTNLAAGGGILTFKRLDESLPFPIDPVARPAIYLDVPTPIGTPRDLFGLSRYLLTVTNLDAGNYDVLIDGEVVSTASAADLAKGLDLGLVNKGPVYAQTQRLWTAVQANLVDALSKTPLPPENVVPRVLPEAQPEAHTWMLRRAR